MTAPRAKDPLNGVTLEAMLSALVAHFGWSELGERVAINSFKSDPSIASSLKFLRKTQWAREKVESLYLFMLREQTRQERNAPVAAPFGSWASPVTADSIVGDSIRLGQIGVLGSDIFWTEGRPQEQGRNVLVWRSGDGRMRDMTPAPLNVRSRVHEYGGGAFTLGRKAGFFVNDADQQVWRLRAGEAPHALTALPGKRHADLEIDAHHKRLICVREDHGDSGEAVTTLVAISLANGTEQVLVSGHDFFSNPRLSPDGRSLAWLGWDHPNMPWDGTTLWLATVAADGKLGPARSVAGGVNESIFQPSWSPRGELHFVSDRSGWWNLYRVRAADDSLQALHPMEAEFGQAQWAFAMSRYGFDARGRIVCSVTQDGRSMLALLDADAGTFEPIQTPFCSIHELQVGDGFAVFLGSTETAAEAVIRFDLARGTFDVLRSTTRGTLDESLVSKAEAFSFPTEHGLTAHALFYPPVNPRFHGPQGELPPLIVVGHGGPTGATNAAFRLGYQYWTSRGFAIVDVNYGGSIGYGRAYRERLNGAWGVVDVVDAINAARFLIERGDVDAERVVIRGSSAGGYTTLSALTFHRFFKAGASHYGIGDLEALVRDTHKFESRYLDSLIGPYPSPLYRERSPIHHTDQLASPMILFQGAEDKAVPPAQAEAMFEAVRAKGLPVAYLLFEGEQHGFRRAATIKRALEAELFFYGRVLGFTPADRIEPVVIENLPASASASASA